MAYDPFEFFQFRRIFKIPQNASITIQISALALLHAGMILGYFFMVQQTGKMDGYAPGVSLLFVPLYEELIFRGVLLRFFEAHYGKIRAVVAVSALFGLWHLKNIFWLELGALEQQIAYTALLFSPVVCGLTLKTRSVWPAVMLHYLNNFPFAAWIQHFRI